VGVAGVCWDVKIMNLRIFPVSVRYGLVSNAVEAIGYAVEKGAKILNASFGGGSGAPPSSYGLRDAIEDANDAGCLFIASAGNRGKDNDIISQAEYPASYDLPNIISVMATTDTDSKWSSSNHGGDSVDLAAPGENILSTTPTYDTDVMSEFNISTSYGSDSGTSMAAPMVSGACALVWSLEPSMNYLAVKQVIMDTVDYLDLDCVTGGRLNLFKALKYLDPVISIKNTSGEKVAWFSKGGALFLGGTLTSSTTPVASANEEFRIQNSSSQDVAIINATTGNMVIEGSVFTGQTDLSNASNYILKDDNDNVVGYINDSGNLYLKGYVVENYD